MHTKVFLYNTALSAQICYKADLSLLSNMFLSHKKIKLQKLSLSPKKIFLNSLDYICVYFPLKYMKPIYF